MKKLILLILPLIFLTSCQITEEVYFRKNGSGTYNMKINMSGMTGMFKDVVKKDSLHKDKAPKKYDTLIVFADVYQKNKDSIEKLPKEKQEFFESLKDAKMRMHLDEAKDEMYITYEIPFSDIDELANVDQKLQQFNALNKNGSKGMDNMIPGYKVSYEFDQRHFRRKVTKLKDSTQNKASDKEQFLKMVQYKMIYHFPYKIDEVSYKNALLGADGKSVHIIMPLDSLLKNKDLLNFKVTFR